MDEILISMAKDMAIVQFSNESQTEYTNRILYSALACWIKASALDRSVGNENNPYSGISRKHITEKCDRFLSEMLVRHPESKSWFVSDNADSPTTLIRNRLLRNGELLNVGFDSNVILAQRQELPLTRCATHIKGVVLHPGIPYNGISLIQEKADNVVQPTAFEEVVSWFDNYIAQAWWGESHDDLGDDVQFFDPFAKTRNNSKNWNTLKPEEVKGIILARRTVNKASHEYFLIRTDDNIEMIHRIDPFLKEIGEHRRFMIALRNISGNKNTAKVRIHKDHVTFNIWIYLPQRELTLFESFAWPKSNYSDIISWEMKLNVYKYIKPFLLALGIDLREEYDG